jgi:hypothetical protein
LKSALFSLVCLIATPAQALDAEGIAWKAVDLLGKTGLAKKNDVELLKFSIKHPVCAQTIFAKTIAQDYSLIATTAGIKAAKVGAQVSIEGLKSFNESMCHALSPLQRFYAFVERTGGKFVPNSSYVKQLAKQEMDKGKTQLEGELVKVPVAGSVLQNWDCLCDAAFESNLSEEAIATDLYPKGAKLVVAAKKGDVGDVVEIALTEFGPAFACALGAEYSGVGHIPVVGQATKDTCAGVLGKVLAWGVKGAGAVKDAAISFGETVSQQGKHIDPVKYYEMYWRSEVHTDVLALLRMGKQSLDKSAHKIKYDHCVSYFDSNGASSDSAVKWCGKMQTQLAAEVNAKLEEVKAAQGGYFASRLKSEIPRLTIENFYLVGGATKLTTIEPFKKLWFQCRVDLMQQITLPGWLPNKNPMSKVTSSPLDAWSWACDGTLSALEAALAAYKGQGIPGLLAKLTNAGCKNHKLSTPALFQMCDSYEGVATCVGEMKSLGAKASHCLPDGTAAQKLAQKIATELGKRCQVAANPRAIDCTRPWKQEQCKLLVQQKQGSANPAEVISCVGKGDPAFETAKNQAKVILDALNAVQKVGTVQLPGGGVQGAVSASAKTCTHGYDPLAINCASNPKRPAEASVSLPACAADPNRDGADVPCLVSTLHANHTPQTLIAQAAGPVVGAIGAARSTGSAQAIQDPVAHDGGVPPLQRVPTAAQSPAADPRGVFKGESDIPKGDRGRVQSTLPAARSPQAAVRTPPPGSSAPNWGSLGGGTSAPVEASTRIAPPTLAANVAPATAEITRQMNAVSCSADRGGLRFQCTTRTGFDRCEALRAQHKVEQCTLNERR